MKRILAFLLAMILLLSAVGVSAASLPEFMTEIYNNYTLDYKFSMSISNADELVDFFDELEISEEVEKYVDLKAVIESVCSSSSVVNVQADVSKDFRKIKAAFTSQTEQQIVFNSNFDTSYRARYGIWLDMDLDAKKFVVIYSAPLLNKYAVIDFAKDLPAEVSEAIFETYDRTYNEEFWKKHNKELTDIITKYADISAKGSKYTVKYDNDSFVALIDEVIDYIGKIYSDMEYDAEYEAISFDDIPSLEGIQLLGDKGIECTYVLSGNKIKSMSENWDISINIADIYTRFYGMTWDYNYSGDINFKLESIAEFSKIGSTRVSIPELTDENSFKIAESFNSPYEDYEVDYNYANLNYYVWGSVETDTFDGVRYYIPVRASIEEAYYESSEITYDNGLITIITDCGDTSKDINATFRVGEDTAIVNGILYEDLGVFKMIDGSVYASVDFYEKCLGWTLEALSKDLLYGGLNYEFCTNSN